MTIPFVIENIKPVVAGAKVTYDIAWTGVSSLSSLNAKVYRNNQDITSTVMPSGSHSSSGNVQVLKKIEFQSAHGNSKYVVVFEAVLDSGDLGIRKFVVEVVTPSDDS